MGFLDKVDIEEKACDTVQNAFKMHEPTKKMVVDRIRFVKVLLQKQLN